MFTGLIRHVGKLVSRREHSSGARLVVGADPQLLARAEHGASIAVMGVCLTVAGRGSDFFEADVSRETLSVSTLGFLPFGAELNLEPALLAGEPLDGHLVSGHVDATGTLSERSGGEGYWSFVYPAVMAPMLAAKGSIAVDGISLTIVSVSSESFSVALIPETINATTLKNLKPGNRVNLEADSIARYVARVMGLRDMDKKLLQIQ